MAVHYVLLGAFAYFVSSTTAVYISITTPTQSVPENDFTFTLLSKHGKNIDEWETIIFKVKACQDAYIGLMETNDINTALYDVLIGGWHNSRTVLFRNKIDKPHLIEYNGKLLDCHCFKKFIVKWANGTIKLLRLEGNSWIQTLSYSTPNTSRIKFVGLKTSLWADGEWKIFIQETSEMPSETIQPETWRQDKDRKDQTYTSPKYIITNHVSRLDCLQKCQMHCDCLYVTYNTALCQGFSEIKSSPVFSRRTSMWMRL